MEDLLIGRGRSAYPIGVAAVRLKRGGRATLANADDHGLKRILSPLGNAQSIMGGVQHWVLAIGLVLRWYIKQRGDATAPARAMWRRSFPGD